MFSLVAGFTDGHCKLTSSTLAGKCKHSIAFIVYFMKYWISSNCHIRRGYNVKGKPKSEIGNAEFIICNF